MSLNYLVLLTDITDYNFNFKKLFSSKDSIIWKNCSNLTIRIDSKINKIIFNNCKNINLICNKTISGIEYFKCHNINQSIGSNHKINCIDVYSSELTLNISKKIKLPKIINERSKISLEYND